MSWEVTFQKEKGVDNDSYLDEFLKQSESKISGLELKTTVDGFEAQLSNWDGYKNYFTGSKFIARGAYMDIDNLVSIHESSQHGLKNAYEPTKNTVFNIYKGDEDEKIPMIPFVLEPVNFMRLGSSSECEISYELLREGRSRLAGVVKAKEKGYHSDSVVPVLFAIRRARR